MTAEIVNLNKVRKARERAIQEKEAHQNRLKYGQPKPERSLFQAEQRKSQADLDGVKRETDRNSDSSDEADPSNVS
jgi:hypothetical protein